MKKSILCVLLMTCALPALAQERSDTGNNPESYAKEQALIDQNVAETVEKANKGPKPTPLRPSEEILKQIYDDSKFMNNPMPPSEIIEQRYITRDVQRATNMPLGVTTARTRNIQLTLRPGETTPTIRAVRGKVTVVTFYDLTGQPWPIGNPIDGNSAAFKSSLMGEVNVTNQMVIANSATQYIDSNVAVPLAGSALPAIFNIQFVEEGDFDARLDVKIQKTGPNARTDITRVNTLPATDEDMHLFLNGTAPEGSVKLKMSTPEVRAWRLNGKMYVVTEHSLMSPAPLGTSRHSSGENVYILQDTPAMMMSINGRTDTVFVKEGQ